jgi:hypothetical protein
MDSHDLLLTTVLAGTLGATSQYKVRSKALVQLVDRQTFTSSTCAKALPRGHNTEELFSFRKDEGADESVVLDDEYSVLAGEHDEQWIFG